MPQSHQFRRADALVLGAILLIIGVLVPPLLAGPRELSNRAACAANLRGIMSACIIYSAQNSDLFPYIGGTSATTYDPALKPQTGKATCDDTINAICKDKLYPNNPYAPLWLLVLQGAAPKLFICKDDPFAGKGAELMKDKLYYNNFQDAKNISYSLAYMWQEDEKGNVKQSGIWTNTSDASLPMMSDMAPYLSEKAGPGEAATQPAAAASQPSDALVFGREDTEWSLAAARSQNHGFAGQNVAFGDVHVDWTRRADVGQNNENIWTMTVDKKEKAIDAGKLPAKLTAVSAPYDTVMVPTRSAKGELK